MTLALNAPARPRSDVIDDDRQRVLSCALLEQRVRVGAGAQRDLADDLGERVARTGAPR